MISRLLPAPSKSGRSATQASTPTHPIWPSFTKNHSVLRCGFIAERTPRVAIPHRIPGQLSGALDSDMSAVEDVGGVPADVATTARSCSFREYVAISGLWRVPHLGTRNRVAIVQVRESSLKRGSDPRRGRDSLTGDRDAFRDLLQGAHLRKRSTRSGTPRAVLSSDKCFACGAMIVCDTVRTPWALRSGIH